MLAGLAMSAAMTRSRSPARSSCSRRRMRYCIGLVSGTRYLREQLVDQANRGRVIPVALAVDPESHPAPCVDDEGHRQPPNTPVPRRFLLRIEQYRQGDALTLEELRDLLRKLAVVHGEHPERLARPIPAQPPRRRQLPLA